MSLNLVRELIRPEIGRLADEFTPESVLSLNVDWNIGAEQPGVVGDAWSWLRRLAAALTH